MDPGVSKNMRIRNTAFYEFLSLSSGICTLYMYGNQRIEPLERTALQIFMSKSLFRIRIGRTGTPIWKMWRIRPDPDPKHWFIEVTQCEGHFLSHTDMNVQYFRNVRSST